MRVTVNINKAFVPVLACALLLCACDYIVLPDLEEDSSAASKGWSAVATNISTSGAGELRIDIALRNDTADWSTMQAAQGKPAVLAANGKSTNCDTVFVSTGGHRLAPGFQMRGFVAGTQAEPAIQLLYVECKGATAAPGSKLSLDYTYYTGEYNYYDQQANKAGARMEVNLDQVVKDLRYPVAAPVEGLIQPAGAQLTALNNCVLTLTAAARTDKGLQFTWQTANPGEYPTYVHIGNPPVIGADGILYGLYESPHLESTPITGAGKTAEWTTEVAVPKDVTGLVILLSVETGKQRLFTHYAIDIAGK